MLRNTLGEVGDNIQFLSWINISFSNKNWTTLCVTNDGTFLGAPISKKLSILRKISIFNIINFPYICVYIQVTCSYQELHTSLILLILYIELQVNSFLWTWIYMILCEILISGY